jgi:hypothetical protein
VIRGCNETCTINGVDVTMHLVRRVRRPPVDDHADVARQLRAAILEAMGSRSVAAVADICQCSPRTIEAIITRRNFTMKTAGRILAALGYRVRVSVEPVDASPSPEADARVTVGWRKGAGATPCARR